MFFKKIFLVFVNVILSYFKVCLFAPFFWIFRDLPPFLYVKGFRKEGGMTISAYLFPTITMVILAAQRKEEPSPPPPRNERIFPPPPFPLPPTPTPSPSTLPLPPQPLIAIVCCPLDMLLYQEKGCKRFLLVRWGGVTEIADMENKLLIFVKYTKNKDQLGKRMLLWWVRLLKKNLRKNIYKKLFNICIILIKNNFFPIFKSSLRVFVLTFKKGLTWTILFLFF